ncbi:MAG: MFS transporter [Oscillospiraceae bacterium]|nr:MFS transporter [Oscillospiraceae bacterium]
MYGSKENINHNMKMFFIDGITFMPSMALISITSVIPYFLDQLGASTFQIALATTMALVCVLVTQPVFGYIASRAKVMHKTFARILLAQRLSFLLFVLLIPVFSGSHPTLINLFLFFWFIFNIFVGSYAIFFTPLIIRLLPPDKRGTLRGYGLAIGSFLGVGMSALIPLILNRIVFPYNFMTIFALGAFFLFVNVVIFFSMRQSDDFIPNEPMSISQYLREMPSTVRTNPPFRAMILTCVFLAMANSILPYYTLYAIREFSATETHVAVLAGLAILSAAIGNVSFGYVIDRFGPRTVAVIAANCLIAAGVLILTIHSLYVLFVAWALANICNSGTLASSQLLFAEVSPQTKIPLYVGVFTIISASVSSAIVLLFAPILEGVGFAPLFAMVLTFGFISLMVNIFVLKKRLAELADK